jgi:hypothetical protein
MKIQQTNREQFKNVKQNTEEIFFEAGLDELMVSGKQQLDEIEKLKTGLRYEQFFFVVNVEDFSVQFANGLEEIGFDSNTFTMMQYAQLIPSPGLLQILSILWMNIFEFNIKEKRLLSFLTPKYIVQIPLKNSKGEIMLVKRTISAFQFTKSGKLIQYLSEFTIIKKTFDSESPEPRFTDMPAHIEEKFSEIMNKTFVWKASPFSPKEMQILNVYAKDDGAKSVAELADEAGVTPATLKYYNKEILARTKDFLGEIFKFNSAKEIAIFLKKCGVLVN